MSSKQQQEQRGRSVSSATAEWVLAPTQPRSQPLHFPAHPPPHQAPQGLPPGSHAARLCTLVTPTLAATTLPEQLWYQPAQAQTTEKRHRAAGQRRPIPGSPVSVGPGQPTTVNARCPCPAPDHRAADRRGLSEMQKAHRVQELLIAKLSERKGKV